MAAFFLNSLMKKSYRKETAKNTALVSPLLKKSLSSMLCPDNNQYCRAHSGPQIDMRKNKRRLTGDTYAQSLIHVNRLYHKAFGSDNRKVPAHMPHMIDRFVFYYGMKQIDSQYSYRLCMFLTLTYLFI